jgi:hypothetical protein
MFSGVPRTSRVDSANHTRDRHLGYWILQLAGWACYFYAQASGEVIFASVPWSRASLLWGTVCARIGISLTIVIAVLVTAALMLELLT